MTVEAYLYHKLFMLNEYRVIGIPAFLVRETVPKRRHTPHSLPSSSSLKVPYRGRYVSPTPNVQPGLRLAITLCHAWHGWPYQEHMFPLA
jgi:hypothetical protein